MSEVETAPLQAAGSADWLLNAADIRGNVIRMVAIAGFYSIHLLHVYVPGFAGSIAVKAAEAASDASVSAGNSIHLSVSLIVFAWMMMALGVHLATLTGQLTRRMAAAVIAGDVIWLTAALCFSTGAAGPMVAGYFLIIGLAGLRLDLWLVRWSAIAAAVGYVFVLGATRWPVGLLKQVDLVAVPRYHQLMVLVAIGLMGILVGQIVRLGWGVVAEKALRSQTSTGRSCDE